MGYGHVVEHEDVTLLPWVHRLLRQICSSQFVKHVWLDRRAVAVVGVGRKIFLFEFRQQSVADRWLESGDVKECSVIEPEPFTCEWMLRSRLPDLARLESVAVFPLNFNCVVATKLVNDRAIGSLKNCLPLKPKAVVVIANVEDLQFRKASANCRAYALIDLSAVGDGCLTAFRRALDATEVEFQRPAQPIGTFVVQEDRMFGRILRRSVDTIEHLATRRRAIAVFE